MLSLIPIIAALGLTVQAADSSDVDFVTRLVEDSKSHRKDYLRYIQTAKVDVPAQFTSLAVKVQTYTDESYTTLIDSDNINVQSLESFATNLPWYKERLAGSDSGSKSGSGSDSVSTTKSGSSSSSKSGSSSSLSKSSSSTTGSSSSSGLGSSIIVPAGTTLAGLIVALL